MLKVENLSFQYDKTPVLSNIDFSVKTGEHISIIGESGSGKSTLLKLLYGEFDLDYGKIWWNNIEILGPKFNLVVGYGFIKYVAQEFDLMPFTTVEENVGKFLSNFYPKAKKSKVKELIKVVELESFSQTKVKNLSGGQKQRVALARALAKEPEIILLDEPFSHIDNFKKQSLRRSLFNYLKEKQITCIVATHDKDDVLGFADKMIVLNNNRIVGIKSPQEFYNQPQLPMIASFFGEFNLIKPFGIVYAHQLKVVRDSDFKVKVQSSYFNGKNYLIEAELNSKSVFFEYHKALNKEALVSLKVDL